MDVDFQALVVRGDVGGRCDVPSALYSAGHLLSLAGRLLGFSLPKYFLSGC